MQCHAVVRTITLIDVICQACDRHHISFCQAQDLTPVPDTSVLSPVISVPVQAEPAAPVLPEKWVCLTFDDGPSKTTPEVLAALDAAGVHGTFFVVATGYNEKYLPLLTQAAAAGHQIALHSASHEYSDIYRSSAAYWKDIALLKERIAPYVDTENIRYLRFPGGSTNTVSRRYGGRTGTSAPRTPWVGTPVRIPSTATWCGKPASRPIAWC